MVASELEPEVALGFAFLFYGGLRNGEIVNLTIESINYTSGELNGEKGVILEIRNRRHILFNHLKDTSEVGVKKERNQAVLNDPIIHWLLNKHFKNLDKVNALHSDTNTDALFISRFNGRPISGKVLSNKFNRVKKEYLSLLSQVEGRKQDFEELNRYNWSTHIGRGTFTNLIVEAGFTPEQTAIARGDSNINSALDYTDHFSELVTLN